MICLDCELKETQVACWWLPYVVSAGIINHVNYHHSACAHDTRSMCSASVVFSAELDERLPNVNCTYCPVFTCHQIWAAPCALAVQGAGSTRKLFFNFKPWLRLFMYWNMVWLKLSWIKICILFKKNCILFTKKKTIYFTANYTMEMIWLMKWYYY